MRIAILQGAFLPVPPLRGGAVEKMWFKLGQVFAERGHEVVHLSRRCDGLGAREQIGGVQHVRVRGAERTASSRWNLVPDFFYTLRARRSLPPVDVVVTNTFWAPLLLSSRHGRIYVDVQRMPRGQIRRYTRAARLRANSSAVADAIAAEAPALAGRVRMIPNPLPFEADHLPDFSRKENIVLFAGRLHPEKGIELLLRAWSRQQPHGPLAEWKLRLIGPSSIDQGGGGDAWVESLRKKYGGDRIEWRPPIYGTAALNRAYEAARVFVYPSLAEKGETFGVAILEAMAWGGAPVVSDLGCFRDFVTPERNGVIFDHRAADPAAALLSALECAAASSLSLGQAALGVRETHSAASIADQFLEDFATLAAARPPA